VTDGEKWTNLQHSFMVETFYSAGPKETYKVCKITLRKDNKFVSKSFFITLYDRNISCLSPYARKMGIGAKV
jgi:hypothetical protein